MSIINSVENDGEVENILLNNPICETEMDQPLSPVLCSNKRLRKKKREFMKSKIKLSKRYETEDKHEHSEPDIQVFNEQSFSFIETDDLIKSIDRLEELEKNREAAYKSLIKNNQSNSFFKKPVAPAPKRPKPYVGSSIKPQEIKLEPDKEKLNYCEKIISFPQQPFEMPKTSNFQTATGKVISLSEGKLIQHSKLFEDILNSSQDENNRKNKFNFLKKPAAVNASDVEKCKVLNMKTEMDKSQIFFTQEICDSGISNTQILNAVDNVLNNIDSAISSSSDFKGFDAKDQFEYVALINKFEACIHGNKQNHTEKRKYENNSIQHLKNKKIKLNTDICFSSSSTASKEMLITNYSIEKAQSRQNNLESGYKSNVNLYCSAQKDKLNMVSEFTKLKTDTVQEKLKLLSNYIGTGSDMEIQDTILVHPSNFGGFSNASGHTLHIQPNSFKKAETLFNDIGIKFKSCENLGFINLYNKEKVCKESKTNNIQDKINLLGTDMASESHRKITECDPNQKSKLVSSTSNFRGFSSASGHKIDVNTKSLNKAKNVFENLDVDIDIKHFESKNNADVSKPQFFHQERDRNACTAKKGSRTPSEMKNKYNSSIEDKLKLLGEYTESSEQNSNKKPKLETILMPSKSNFGGFSSASGHKIDVNTNSLNKAKNVFENLDLDIDTTNFESKNNADVGKLQFFHQERDRNACTAKTDPRIPSEMKNKYNSSIKDKLNLLGEYIESPSNIKTADQNSNKTPKLDTISVASTSNFGGFSSASGHKIDINTKSLNKAKNVFENLDIDIDTKNFESKNNVDVGKPQIFHQERNNNAFNDVSTAKSALKGSSEVKNKSQSSLKDKLKYFDQLIGDDCDFVPRGNLAIPQAGFNNNKNNIKSSTGVKSKLDFFDNLLGKEDIIIPNNSFQSSKKFGNFPNSFNNHSVLSTPGLKKASSTNELLINSFTNYNTPDKKIEPGSSKSRKKLGVSSCRQISIAENKLQKAKLLFDEDFAGISPIKPLVQNFTNFEASTPVRHNLQVSKSCTEDNETLTNKEASVDETINNLKLNENLPLTFENPDDGGGKDFAEDVENEVKKLEERLIVMKTRQEAIKNLNVEKKDCDKKPKAGVLYKAKMQKNRVSLRMIVSQQNLGQNQVEDFFCISPHNAGQIHFKESRAKVITEDGANVIPSVRDLIGINQIEYAFTKMPGVDPRLVPRGWLKNHYKWIIWKLASYERLFSTVLKGSLTVESVMQQLKYRYDREIDKAERSALRKILEKDDVPQKRMVLSVSVIKQVNINNYELELTDGWYGIRTIIDEPLCHQILKGRMKIGTKLIICGAELMNCEGCHPLEVTDLTYLKINYNCTRRAKWDARLGYQNCPGPFSVPIHTVHPNGGHIGSIDVCIARVYPFRYLDKSEVRSVWRNKRAEERRAQEWERDRYKKIEKIQEDLRKELSGNFDKENMTSGQRHKNTDISGVTCPKTLLEMIESSNDPEHIQGLLTPSQKSSLVDYNQRVFLQKQHEVAVKIKSSAENLKMAKRDVVAMMKLLVVDLNGSPTNALNFFIWNPVEWHVQTLKEEACLTIFNVTPKTNGDLYSNIKTVFKTQPFVSHMSEIFRRQLIKIEELNDLKFSKNFSSFDTVGIIVQTITEVNNQEIWLCNSSGRLLFISIYESPSTCLLSDNLKRGQATSVCNLEYLNMTGDICRSRANHFTIFSSYPKYKHLDDGINELKLEVPKDLSKILEECDNRIQRYKLNIASKSSFSLTLDETFEDTRITSTDIALSMLDMDNFT